MTYPDSSGVNLINYVYYQGVVFEGVDAGKIVLTMVDDAVSVLGAIRIVNEVGSFGGRYGRFAGC